MIFRRRSPLSLIEISIAATLVSVVLFFLFSAFRNSTFLAANVEKVKPVILNKQMLYQRLLQIFSFIEPKSLKKNDNVLDFTFENHLDPKLIYSGKVSASIFIDEEKNLVLQIKPNKKIDEVRTELLHKNVGAVQFDNDTPTVLIMKIEPLDAKPLTYAFFLPKTDNNGLAVKAEKAP